MLRLISLLAREMLAFCREDEDVDDGVDLDGRDKELILSVVGRDG